MRSKRSSASTANGSVTSRGRARRRPGAVTVAANMYEQDAHQASEHATWTVVVNTQQGTAYAPHPSPHPPHNVKAQPPNLTVEHEIDTGHGSPHQRQPHPGFRSAAYPGAIYYHIPKTREPQCVETIPTNGGERLGSMPKPNPCQPEALNILSQSDTVRPPRCDGDQDLDGRHPNPDILNLHLAFTDEASAGPVLSAIHDTIQYTPQDSSRTTSLILSGDFNHHHPAWGNNHIQPRFIEDAGEQINFFHDHGLQSCLPRGTATFWSMSCPGRNSMIDQTVTERPDVLIKRHLYHDSYGSDHRATYSEWNFQSRRNFATKPREVYDRADWDKFGEEIMNPTGRQEEIDSKRPNVHKLTHFRSIIGRCHRQAYSTPLRTFTVYDQGDCIRPRLYLSPILHWISGASVQEPERRTYCTAVAGFRLSLYTTRTSF